MWMIGKEYLSMVRKLRIFLYNRILIKKYFLGIIENIILSMICPANCVRIYKVIYK